MMQAAHFRRHHDRTRACMHRVRSMKEECLDGLIPIGDRHYRRALTEYVEHYHGDRNHQGIGNRLISGPSVIEMTGRVRRRPRLGGLLNFFARAA